MTKDKGKGQGRDGMVRVVGHGWAPESHGVKDLLARHRIPYRWLELEADAEARRAFEELDPAEKGLPLLLFADGSHLVNPSDKELAGKLGLETEAAARFYDLVIVGGGPAGLAAAVYGASEGLRTVVVEREVPGGQAGLSARIENYLGFPEGLSGAELAERAVTQARRFGAEVLAAREAVGLGVAGPYRAVRLDDGAELLCHTVLIATGVNYRRLEVPGSESLTGAGVYYGAASAEATACQDHDVYLLGGGNSAGQAAVLLAQYARNVVMLIRDDALGEGMSKYLADRIEAVGNIRVRPHSEVVRVEGERSLEAITVRDTQSDEVETVRTSRLFVWIGGTPRTQWLAETLQLDEQGFVVSGSEVEPDEAGWRGRAREPFLLEASLPGVFVAGDVRSGSIKRVASAVGEGAMVIQFVHGYLRRGHPRSVAAAARSRKGA